MAYSGAWLMCSRAALLTSPGKSTTLSAKENAVGLPTATWSLKNFTVEQYQAELAKIVNGEITVDNNSEMSNPEKAELSNVKVNFVG